MIKNLQSVLITLLILLSFNKASYAFLSLNVNSEDIPKTKILFLGFSNINPSLQKDSFEVLDKIRKNLKTTDLFEVINQAPSTQVQSQTLDRSKQGINLAQETFNLEALPEFEKYNKIGVGAIVIAQFNYDKIGNLEARLRMWDVLDQRQLFGKFYTASHDNYRKMANVISDEIFKAITGEKIGHFSSQITYVAETGLVNRRTKQIATIDFDGNNHRLLTNARDLVLTPVFTKNLNEILYVKYFEQRPQIFNLDVRTLRSKKVGGFRGTNFSAAINPLNSNKILLSAIVDDNSDIYELDIAENSALRLTKTTAIDTTPSYSPDTKSIAFTSDRDSGQQIYIMSMDGSSVKRISSSGASYSKPIWSPDGKLIAYTKIKGGQFFIGTMKPDGSAERILSSGYLVEGARWSPNGRYIIFSKKKEAFGPGSVPRLRIVDIVTGFEYEIPTPEGEGATDPDWR
jgi:TolB protein